MNVEQPTLRRLPSSARLTLTAFLIIIAAGYLTALANIYHSHQLADGRAGLSFDDIRAVYGGLKKDAQATTASRMLTMIRTSMREYIRSADDFQTLEAWLTSGAQEAALDEGPSKKTPRRTIIRNCLRCHAQSTNSKISRNSPFGPDELTVDYAMLAPFISPTPANGKATAATEPAPPQYTLSRLVLVAHIHMLAIPVYTVLVAALFFVTRLSPRLKHAILPIPMAALFIDFTGWWLARGSPLGAVLIAAGGAIYGLAFAVQLIAVLMELWSRPVTPAVRE